MPFHSHHLGTELGRLSASTAHFTSWSLRSSLCTWTTLHLRHSPSGARPCWGLSPAGGKNTTASPPGGRGRDAIPPRQRPRARAGLSAPALTRHKGCARRPAARALPGNRRPSPSRPHSSLTRDWHRLRAARGARSGTGTKPVSAAAAHRGARQKGPAHGASAGGRAGATAQAAAEEAGPSGPADADPELPLPRGPTGHGHLLPALPGGRRAEPRSGRRPRLPGRRAEGLRARTGAAWRIRAVTHRRREKPLRRPPGCAQPASRGAGILPSFVSRGRSAPLRLADGRPAAGTRLRLRFPASALLSPRPFSVPPAEPALTRSHDVIRRKSAVRKAWLSRRARGHAARAEAARGPRRSGALPDRVAGVKGSTGRGPPRGASEGECGRGEGGRSPGGEVRAPLRRFLSRRWD